MSDEQYKLDKTFILSQLNSYEINELCIATQLVIHINNDEFEYGDEEHVMCKTVCLMYSKNTNTYFVRTVLKPDFISVNKISSNNSIDISIDEYKYLHDQNDVFLQFIQLQEIDEWQQQQNQLVFK